MKSQILRVFPALERHVQSIWPAIAASREVGPKRVLFISPRHGDGTTTVAACTALALSLNLSTRLALVEANPFESSLAAYASLPASPSFADLLRDALASDSAFPESGEPGLVMLPGGSLEAADAIDWRGVNTLQLFESTLKTFPIALIDGPPLLDRPAGRMLLEHCDQVVLVCRAGHTTKADAAFATKILRDSGVPLLGVVLNRFRRPLLFNE